MLQVLGMGELRLPGDFSYESEESAQAYLRQVPLEVLVERVLLEKAVGSGRRVLHTHDARWGAYSFKIEFSVDRKTFRIAMTVSWGANKSANGITSYYMASLISFNTTLT